LKYEEKILTYLIENYRKSKKDSGDNKTNRRTQVKPEKFYIKYNANDGDFDDISKLNKAASELSEKGFVKFDTETFGTQIQCIYLIDERVRDAERYLCEKYGYISKDMQIDEVQQLIDQYRNASSICKEECDILQELVKVRRVPKNYQELRDIFKAVAFIENNQDNLYIREVSMKIYGDSKFFEKITLQPVCTILRKYSGIEVEDSELLDEILTNYHIYKEPQKLCIKGNAVINISGKAIDVSAFSDGIEIMATELSNIKSVNVMASRFMTVENRTSYLRYKDDDTVIFYLGGYANRYQRDFIKMIYSMNSQVEYLHFGDIDAGGFWIHNNLCDITGVKFALFGMSVKELQDKNYESCLQQLTDNDIIRLKELSEMEQYSKTVSYILKNNVKLEQEIISLYLMDRK
jgi:hypothetical protein